MSDTPQHYKNHVRYHPPFHFVLAPLLLINLLWCLISLWRNPGADSIHWLLIAAILLVVGVLTRTSALKAQDRVIRLEEKLRYREVLSPELAKQAEALKISQIIALRFASDAELPGLIQQTLAGKFANSKEIKLAIQNWRGDFLRV